MDRIWGIWGSYSNTPTAIFYLLGGTIGRLGFCGFGGLRGCTARILEDA